MHITLLHNPKAGGGQPARDRLLALLRKAGYDPIYWSVQEDDVTAALAEPGELVVAAGGDGTVRKAALRLAGRGIPLAVLPLGTANNVARALGIAGSPEQIVAGWAEGRRKPFDLGVGRGPWGETSFIEGLGCGLFPRVMAIDASRGEKDRTGSDDPQEALRAHLYLLKEQLVHGPAHPLKVVLDGREVAGKYLLLEAMNIKSIGPNLLLAPEADPGDGLLDLVLVAEEERDGFVDYLQRRMEGDESPPAFPVRKVRHVRFWWEGVHVHIDDALWPGEEPGSPGDAHADPAAIDIRVKPQALEFLL